MSRIRLWVVAGLAIVTIASIACWLVLYVGVQWLAHGIGAR